MRTPIVIVTEQAASPAFRAPLEELARKEKAQVWVVPLPQPPPTFTLEEREGDWRLSASASLPEGLRAWRPARDLRLALVARGWRDTSTPPVPLAEVAGWQRCASADEAARKLGKPLPPLAFDAAHDKVAVVVARPLGQPTTVWIAARE